MSNGSGTSLFIGRTSQGDGSIRRTLVAFDIAGSIPAGSTIVSASLQMQVTKTPGGTFDAELHRVLSDWGEGASDALGNEGRGIAAESGDATWTHAFLGGAAWGSAGGDFVGTVSGSASLGSAGLYTWDSNSQMLADAQAWLDDPSGNFGWIILGDETASRTAKRFASTQSSSSPSRPVLTLEFTPGS